MRLHRNARLSVKGRTARKWLARYVEVLSDERPRPQSASCAMPSPIAKLMASASWAYCQRGVKARRPCSERARHGADDGRRGEPEPREKPRSPRVPSVI